MHITLEFLRNELAGMEQRRAQQVADLNVTDGAVQVLRQLVARAEREDEEPRAIGSYAEFGDALQRAAGEGAA